METFEKLIVGRRVRPTILSPLWRVAGFALGAATARMGPRAAMACTVAVEEVIAAHYREQAERLSAAEPNLKITIEEFRAEELEHRHGFPDATVRVQRPFRDSLFVVQKDFAPPLYHSSLPFPLP